MGRYSDALEGRREMDQAVREHGHDPVWSRRTRTDLDTGKQVPANEFRGVCKNCGGDVIVGPSYSSSTSHATRNIRDNECSGPGTAWQTEMVHDLMHERFQKAVSDYGDALKREHDRAWLRGQGIEAALREAEDGVLVRTGAEMARLREEADTGGLDPGKDYPVVGHDKDNLGGQWVIVDGGKGRRWPGHVWVHGEDVIVREAMGAAGPDYPPLEFEHSHLRYGDEMLMGFHPHTGEPVGSLIYAAPADKPVAISTMDVDEDHRRRGVASQLMGELERRHPGRLIEHGERSDEGKAWADRYYGPHATRPHPVSSTSWLGEPTRDRQVIGMGQAGPDYQGLSFKHMTGFEYGADPSIHHHEMLFAAHPEHGYLGHVRYETHPDQIEIHNLQVHAPYQRRGVATALMGELERRHPGMRIEHGARTMQGADWAQAYYGPHANVWRPDKYMPQGRPTRDRELVAGLRGGPPDGMKITYKPGGVRHVGPPDAGYDEASDHHLIAHIPHPDAPNSGERFRIGQLYLDWRENPDGGHRVSAVSVHERYRRRGVATALWDHAHELGLKPRHEDMGVVTPAGAAWAATTPEDVPAARTAPARPPADEPPEQLSLFGVLLSPVSQQRLAAWFHGTTHELSPGQLMTPEGAREHGLNFPGSSTGHHVYYSENVGLAADYGEPKWDDKHSIGHVYEVEPITRKGEPLKRHLHDPGLRGPGYAPMDYQLAYRHTGPMRVVRELGPEDMSRHTWQRLRRNEKQAAQIPPAERHESVTHMLAHYRPTDAESWDQVRDNIVWEHPSVKAFVDDVRAHGVRRPIPVDYEADPPQVMNGHTRLLAAEKAGVEWVPTRQHQGWLDPDDPDAYGRGPDDPEHWTNKQAAAEFTHEYETYGPTGYVTKRQTVTGPFYHGSRVRLRPGGMIKPGQKPDWGDEFDERGRTIHTYFSTEPETAISYARASHGHLYEVEPTGEARWDAGGGAGSYKSKHPLRIIRHIPEQEWDSLTPGTTKQAAAEQASLYHITDRPDFKLDREHVPEDNALAIQERSRPGLFAAGDKMGVERWVNGHNYVRPYVAEIHAPAHLVQDERWSGEKFLPAEHFDQAKVHRVVPLDAIAREEFGTHGWIEAHHGTEFDTGKPIKASGWNADPALGWHRHYPFHYGPGETKSHAYHYPGPDVRDMSPEQHAFHKQRALDYLHQARGFEQGDVDELRKHWAARVLGTEVREPLEADMDRVAVLLDGSSPRTVIVAPLIKVAHVSGNTVDALHCPFCGSGFVTARSDGTIECGFCTAAYTVQVQPQFAAFPQTVNGVPYPWPGRDDLGMGNAPVAPGEPVPGEEGEEADEDGDVPPWLQEADGGPEEGSEDEDENDEDEDEEEEPEASVGGSKGPPPFTRKSYRNTRGTELSGDDYLRHLAIITSPDPARTAAAIKAERQPVAAGR
jgi:GNAT superfamily N-acetyltransferase